MFFILAKETPKSDVLAIILKKTTLDLTQKKRDKDEETDDDDDVLSEGYFILNHQTFSEDGLGLVFFLS